ncbi:MAG: hypothetical protein Q7J85_07120 [Bacillota bacterium]|nr:hypothetical protein [Bacillota bacterium]
MKVYFYFESEWSEERQIYETVNAVTEEYEGSVALCKGGTTIEAPKPSAEEIALQAEQLKILQLQQTESAQMRPYVLKGMGLMEEDGALRYMTEEERTAGMGELERGQYDLTKMSQERQAQAYAGELPISPALEKSIAGQEKQMQEALSQRLGPNWMMTTPGQQAIASLRQNADLLREEARRGAISGEGGLLLSNLGYLGNVEGVQTQMAGQFPSRTSGLFGGYGQLQQPYQQQRYMEYEASAASAQARAQRQAGLMGGFGSLLGSGIRAGGMYAGLQALGPAAKAAAPAVFLV